MKEALRPASTAVRRPLVIEDLRAWKIANEPQLSPDGSRAVCSLTVTDDAANGYQTHLWIVPAAGGAPWQLTTARARETGPRWSPDGTRIVFLSNRGGDKQLWMIPAEGGEARPLTTGTLAPADPAWSPDGQWIAFTGKPGAVRSRDESDVRVISRLYYKRDGEGFWDGRWKQVFIIRADGSGLRQVTDGEFDHEAPAWSPDGAFLAYTGNASPDADVVEAGDVWVVPAGSGAPPRRLTRTRGPVRSPVWSPDGTRIAYAGHDRSYGGATQAGIWIVPAAGGEPVCVTRAYDRSVGHHIGSDIRSQPDAGGLAWTPRGDRIYFLTTEGPNGQIGSVSVPDGAVRLETDGDHDLVGCSLDRTARRVVCVECDPLTPGEIAAADLGGGPARLRRLTDWNARALDALALAAPERFEYRTPDGHVVDGWVMKPAGAGPERRVPAVLKIHGGPHGAYGNSFSHQFQSLCAAGYGVVYVNPRGSEGYGQAFLAATHHDWGGKDYEDLMGALDRALALHPWIDPDRLGVSGGSYGGYMTNWIVGHTQRFRAAVTLRSTCNRYSHWGTGDIAYRGGDWEWPGDPRESPEFYLERSPITYVRQIRTPLLILHGEDDLRCGITEAEQLFVALKKLGTSTLLVRFPGESHGLAAAGTPRHRIEELRHLLAWFRRYLDAPASDRADARLTG